MIESTLKSFSSEQNIFAKVVLRKTKSLVDNTILPKKKKGEKLHSLNLILHLKNYGEVDMERVI